MAFNLRGTPVVADGSITAVKLAPNSVTSVAIATDAVIDTKIAPNAVTAIKIATDAVTSSKIADNSVATSKISSDVALKHFFGTEQELTKVGNIEESIAEFHFISGSGGPDDWKKLAYAIKLKSSLITNTATFNIYVDGSLLNTETTTSTSYQVFSPGELILSLINGEHLIEIKLNNSIATETAFVGSVDIYLSQKV